MGLWEQNALEGSGTEGVQLPLGVCLLGGRTGGAQSWLLTQGQGVPTEGDRA